jgi:hypothetical protein
MTDQISGPRLAAGRLDAITRAIGGDYRDWMQRSHAGVPDNDITTRVSREAARQRLVCVFCGVQIGPGARIQDNVIGVRLPWVAIPAVALVFVCCEHCAAGLPNWKKAMFETINGLNPWRERGSQAAVRATIGALIDIAKAVELEKQTDRRLRRRKGVGYAEKKYAARTDPSQAAELPRAKRHFQYKPPRQLADGEATRIVRAIAAQFRLSERQARACHDEFRKKSQRWIWVFRLSDSPADIAGREAIAW